MGAACSSLTEEQKLKAKRNRELDKLLHTNQKDIVEEVKLLLLGPGESGKSTVFKQMKIIQPEGGFTPEELKAYRYIVFGNCITQMKVLVSAAEKLEIAVNPENADRASRVAQLPAGGDAWSAEVADDIKVLWKDDGIQETYTHRDKAYQLNDSAAYFFSRIESFIDPGYTPSEQDVLRARVRSTGIEEAEFAFSDLSFRMLDVGGQRSERRKWIHCFDCVTAVVFCASLSAYDQTLREDDSQNRMKEAILLFDEICNSPWFRETAFILFLNKLDLFKEKVQKVDIGETFSGWTGGCVAEKDWEKPAQFIKDKFLKENQGGAEVFSHFTTAVDTENVRVVFQAVKKTLLDGVMDKLQI